MGQVIHAVLQSQPGKPNLDELASGFPTKVIHLGGMHHFDASLYKASSLTALELKDWQEGATLLCSCLMKSLQLVVVQTMMRFRMSTFAADPDVAICGATGTRQADTGNMPSTIMLHVLHQVARELKRLMSHQVQCVLSMLGQLQQARQLQLCTLTRCFCTESRLQGDHPPSCRWT